MLDWNPALCLRFADERTRPAAELPERVPLDQGRHVAALGCGPGHSTELPVQRLPQAQDTGIDSSQAMLEAARRQRPGAAGFVLAEFSPWMPQSGAPDLISAPACLQWLRCFVEGLPPVLRLNPLTQYPNRVGAVLGVRADGRRLPASPRLSIAVQRKP